MSENTNATAYQVPQTSTTSDSTEYYYNYQYPSSPVSNQYYNTQLYNYNGYYNQQSYNSNIFYPETPESGYRSTSYNSNDESNSSYNTEVTTSNSAHYSDIKELDSKPANNEIRVNLSNSKLWTKFNDLTCEMIITKQGRRMFPTLQYEIDNLDHAKKYNVFIDFVQTESTSMKFQAGKWIPSSAPSGEQKKTSVYLHPDSPNSGSFWMKNEIVFSKVKLTNNKKNPDSHMLLNSMHKYIPRIHIVEVNDQNSVPKTFMFNETKFIAVTAYQNTDVTQLKIDNNPFAKGFRENAAREYENSVLISTEKSTLNPSTPSSSNKITPSSFQYAQSTPVQTTNYHNYYNSPMYYAHQLPVYNSTAGSYLSSPYYNYNPSYSLQVTPSNKYPMNQEPNHILPKNKKRSHVESNEGDFYYQENNEKKRRF